MRNCIRDRRSAIGEESLAKPPAPVYPQMHPSSQAGPSLLQERIVTQADVIGAPEPAAAGGMMSFFQRAATGAAGGGAGGAGARGDMYALRDRAGLLAQMEAPPLILHVAESEGKRFPYEVCVLGGGWSFAFCVVQFFNCLAFLLAKLRPAWEGGGCDTALACQPLRSRALLVEQGVICAHPTQPCPLPPPDPNV